MSVKVYIGGVEVVLVSDVCLAGPVPEDVEADKARRDVIEQSIKAMTPVPKHSGTFDAIRVMMTGVGLIPMPRKAVVYTNVGEERSTVVVMKP